MGKVLAVALGGSLGSVLRYLVSEFCKQRFSEHHGSGTLIVNLAGCLLIGWILAPQESRQLSEIAKLFLVSGVLGGLTTFSTFAQETVEFWSRDRKIWALGYFAANLFLGLLCVGLGRWLAMR